MPEADVGDRGEGGCNELQEEAEFGLIHAIVEACEGLHEVVGCVA